MKSESLKSGEEGRRAEMDGKVSIAA